MVGFPSSAIKVGHAYRVIGGNTYHVVHAIEGDRVYWHNEDITEIGCSKAQFMKACDGELSAEDALRLGCTDEVMRRTGWR